MRILVLLEVDDLDVASAVDLVPRDKPSRGQLAEQFVDVASVVRQDFRFNSLRPILQTAGPIGRAPQSGEQDPRQRGALCQLVVCEKRRFQIASPHAARLTL
jgi:hypothetical protein